ncbi:opsin, ultraviolet-sensitive [Uranotaenia lowii]|uniref:opsin, ultraviolet-sensitive n=1 Tax=Uranotaenia lowii TaxID=190385 RepID=UPI002479879B|nr:opsin, ultraviolet-sensitive [Uranotaenia lowii]XP_055602161.1 opsin, ultraviolet-sensitive [Uranotaenia lowii]XP_055602162.1 opsin, ultraviolet-sensitive [Uranotaenia lowii]
MYSRFVTTFWVLSAIIANINANFETKDDSAAALQLPEHQKLPALKMTASLQTVGSLGDTVRDSDADHKNQQQYQDPRLVDFNRSALWSKYIALSGYSGPPIEEAYQERINPFWLQFAPPSPGAHYMLGLVYFLMMVFGLCGNLLVILMFFRFKSLRTPANYLVINLAAADFLIMLEAPLFVYNSYHQGPATGNTWCTIYALLGAVGGTVAIVTLTMISIDRYNVVVYPLNPNRSTTRAKVMLMIVFAWIYGLFFSLMPALEIGWSRYTPEGFLTACSFDYLDRGRDAQIFMFMYFVFAWVVPFLAISYCYVAILRVVIGAGSIQSSKNKSKQELKLAAVVIGIIGLWFIAWTPYAVVAMMGVFGYESLLTPLGSMIPAILAKTAACIDPYFYAMNHPRYRQELKRMFGMPAQTEHSQNQASRYTRGNSRIDSEAGNTERVAVGNKPAADETSLSMSIDLTESKTGGH